MTFDGPPNATRSSTFELGCEASRPTATCIARWFDAADLFLEPVDSFAYGANGNDLWQVGSSKTGYAWNPENRFTQVKAVSATFTETGGQVQAYAYDGVGRRVKVDGTSSSTWTVSIFYGMDAICEENNTGSVTKYVYANGQTEMDTSTALARAGANTSFAYDANGNLDKKMGGWDYDWNVENLMTVAKLNGVPQQTYTYDGLGRRVTVDGVAGSGAWTVSIASGMDLLFEKDNTGAITKYVYANGMRIARIECVGNPPACTTSYFFADHQGSTRKILDAARVEQYAVDYEPFGKPYATSGPQPDNHKYTSEKHDDPTGLVYLRARQYDPEVGRFASADPVLGSLGEPQTLNRYAYVSNNPLTSTDPSGLSACNPQAGDQLYAACQRWASWDAFTSAVNAWQIAHPNPMDFWTAMDLVMTGVGFIPVFGDIVSTVYFLGRDAQECQASGCNWVNIGLDALGFLPLVPALGGAAHLARAANRVDDLSDLARTTRGVPTKGWVLRQAGDSEFVWRVSGGKSAIEGRWWSRYPAGSGIEAGGLFNLPGGNAATRISLGQIQPGTYYLERTIAGSITEIRVPNSAFVTVFETWRLPWV